MVRLLRGLVSCALAGVLMLLAGVTAPAEDRDRTRQVMAWLLAQPVDDLDLEGRLDELIGLVAAQAPADHVTAGVDQAVFLASHRTAPTPLTTLEVAKVVVVLDMVNRNPRTELPDDAVTRLEATLGAKPAAVGQFLATPGAEIRTQAWAMLALHRMGKLPPVALGWLLSRQCPSGAFVAAPGQSTCERGVNPTDQALVLTVLATLRQQNPQAGAATGRLVDWLGAQASAPDPVLVASSHGYLVAPLILLGHQRLAATSITAVRRLQLRSGPNAGAVGGETPQLASEASAKGLRPQPVVSARAVLAFAPINLTTHRYRPGAATGLPALRPTLTPSTTRAQLGDTVHFLLTGFPPNTSVRLVLRGYRADIATGTTDAQGRARLSAALSPPRAGTVSVVVSGAQVQQQARLVLVDTGGAPVDQNSRTGGQRDDEVRLPVLSARHTWLLLGGVLVLMTAAAVALRPRRSS